MSTYAFVSTEPRGCGKRKAGGVYAECGLSAVGMPVEFFLVDPPQVVDEHALGLSSIGVKLINIPLDPNSSNPDKGSVYHVFDIVGQEHYPNVADYIEEVAHLGASRRLPRTLDFAKMTEDSKLVLLHRRAHVDNAGDYFAAMGPWRPAGWDCAKHLPDHLRAEAPTAMCAGLWWCDVEGGQPAVGPDEAEHRTRSLSARSAQTPLTPVTRSMPSFEYRAWARPQNVTPHYQLAIFMILPIHRLAVVQAQDGSHEQAVAAAQQAQLPVEVCDE